MCQITVRFENLLRVIVYSDLFVYLEKISPKLLEIVINDS